MNLKLVALAFLNTAKDDAILAALPLFGNAAISIDKNPSELNAATQAAALQVNLIAEVPMLEQEVLTAMAQFVQASVAALVAKASADLTTQTAVLAAAPTLAASPAVSVGAPVAVPASTTAAELPAALGAAISPKA